MIGEKIKKSRTLNTSNREFTVVLHPFTGVRGKIADSVANIAIMIFLKNLKSRGGVTLGDPANGAVHKYSVVRIIRGLFKSSFATVGTTVIRVRCGRDKLSEARTQNYKH